LRRMLRLALEFETARDAGGAHPVPGKAAVNA
jgi:hypothetical protein